MKNVKRLVLSLMALILVFVAAGCGKTEEVLTTAKNNLIFGSEINSLASDLELPSKIFVEEEEITVAWTSDSEALTIGEPDAEGKIIAAVTRPAAGEDFVTVNLKATLTYKNAVTEKEWKVYVRPMPASNKVTTEEARNAALNEVLEITATVSYVIDGKGFMIQDSAGGFYVYVNAAPAANVKPGAVVTVTGTRAVYYSMPQLTGPSVKVDTEAPETGYDYSTVPTVEIKDMIEGSSTELTNYSKMVRVTGYVQKDSSSPISEYSLKDINNNVLYIYNSSNQAVKDELGTKVGQYVSLVVITYDFHSTQLVWRCLGVAGTIRDEEVPEISDSEKVNAAETEIKAAFDGKTFTSKVNLIATATSGATIAWTSGNTSVVANDGSITFPETDTDVVLTAVITSGTETKAVEITVTVKALVKQTIKQVIDALDAASADIDYVLIEGVIIGTDADGYYYLADETGVVYIRQKIGDLTVGNKVQVIGKATVYKGTTEKPQYTRQISGNYTVKKLDEVIHESPLAVTDVSISDFEFGIPTDQLKAKVTAEANYGKLIRFDAYITVQGSFNNVYLSDNADGSDPKILIYYKSMDQTPLKNLVGKKAKVVAVVYDYHSVDGWRLGFLGREGDIEVALTTEEKVALAKSEIDKIVKEGDNVNGDIAVIGEPANALLAGAKFTWTTDDLATIAASGKFTAPAADKAVKITVNFFLDGNVEGTASATWDINVTAKAATVVVPTTGVIISQAYGGGGNSGATFKSDFVELYNTTDHDIDMTGWVIQYASKTNPFSGDDGYKFVLSGTIKSHSFYLIKMADGTGGTVDLPTPDATGTIAMGGAGFKLALCNNGDTPADATSANIIDFLGAGSSGTNAFEGTGAAPAPSNTTAVVRKTLTDTNDNAADFEIKAPNPRNSAYTGE